MKRLIFIAAVCAFVAGPVLAGPYIRLYYGAKIGDYDTDPFRDGSGGEFTAMVVDDGNYNGASWDYDVLSLYDNDTMNQVVPTYQPAPTQPTTGTFQTFCVESQTYLSGEEGHLYSVDINPYAVSGDGNADATTPGKDYLSIGTAWLYGQFARGQLAYQYDESTTFRDDDAELLQKAIWALEDEAAYVGTVTAANNKYYKAAVDKFAATVRDDANGAFGVAVMNLWGSTTDSQDQLVLVPIPAAVLLGFLGLGAAGMKLRKFS